MDDLSRYNRRVHRGRLLSWQLQRRTELLPAEESIFRRLGTAFAGAEILDIGVGGGRTTRHLLQLSTRYTGIDYAPRMIARCRARYPTLTFEVCDACDLSRFADGRFDLVFFSLNGIDYMAHVDRLVALKEIFRVVSHGGTFMFSSHNRNCHLMRPWERTHLLFGTNPLTKPLRFLDRVVRYPLGIGHHLLNRRHERQMEEYAILNDVANNYRMLTYYISIERQLAQLQHIGFTAIDVVGVDGRWLSSGEYGGCTDPYLHYICR